MKFSRVEEKAKVFLSDEFWPSSETFTDELINECIQQPHPYMFFDGNGIDLYIDVDNAFAQYKIVDYDGEQRLTKIEFVKGWKDRW